MSKEATERFLWWQKIKMSILGRFLKKYLGRLKWGDTQQLRTGGISLEVVFLNIFILYMEKSEVKCTNHISKATELTESQQNQKQWWLLCPVITKQQQLGLV